MEVFIVSFHRLFPCWRFGFFAATLLWRPLLARLWTVDGCNWLCFTLRLSKTKNKNVKVNMQSTLKAAYKKKDFLWSLWTWLLQNKWIVVRDAHSCSLQRNLKEPIFSCAADERGTRNDSLWAEMCCMVSESDIRASVRCHGDTWPLITEPREQ